MTYSLASAVSDAFDIADKAGHEAERLPWGFLVNCWWDGGDDTRGLVALLLGVANWGVELPPSQAASHLADPAGENWGGQRARSGKHMLDGSSKYPYGGIGIAHFDRSKWDDLEARFGPIGIPSGTSFDQALKDSRWRRHLLQWSDALFAEGLPAQVFLAELWVKDYWRPALAAHPGDYGLAAINARIRNSASGIGAGAAGNSEADQVKAYYAYKMQRSKSAADRAMEQVNYARRVGVVFEQVRRFKPFE